MITSIQIHEKVKKELDSLKENSKETYEDVIVKMMKSIEKNKREQKKLLIEGCIEMAEDSLKITKEWAATDSKLDWEW
ncbi:MAG TPA: hypothetical protein VJH20_00305 [Candidatus Nanoarchaeia archaeon]|nr:hypothetical protein [Candidatus Nanoarchaeia archaeon]